jgi:hypothetical protein
LESNGIKAFLIDDRLIPRLNLFYTQEIGAVKLFVRRQDFKDATEILRAHIRGAGDPPFYGAFSSLGQSTLTTDVPDIPQDQPTSRPAKQRRAKVDFTSPGWVLAVFILILLFVFAHGFLGTN